ncbi:hypothetical protein ACCO45_003000 [Purpureocillium lilacinum]|uniref:Uncharacterized protein n=1 Tax=Purpureocillium lilacinum TaxID=33203 RepID=A0ACC4DYN3_PURLI
MDTTQESIPLGNVDPESTCSHPCPEQIEASIEAGNASDDSHFDLSAPFNDTIEDVLRATLAYKAFAVSETSPGIIAKDLSNLDDLAWYGISEAGQMELWTDEVSRLMDLANEPEIPILYRPATADGDKVFATDSPAAHRVTSRFARRMLDAINIIVHDSQAALAINCRKLCNPDILTRSRKHLQAMAAQSSQASAHGAAEELSLEEDHYRFMGYCTAVLSRVVCVAVTRPFPKGCLHFIAELAKISAKLRVVSSQLLNSAQCSLRNNKRYVSDSEYHDGETRTATAANGDDESLSPMIFARHNFEVVGIANSTAKSMTTEMQYYMHTTRHQYAILELLRIMLSSFRSMGLGPDNFVRYEISAALYTRPFASMATLVFQDFDQSYSGSSEYLLVDRAWVPIIVLEAVVKEIHQRNLGDGVRKPEVCVARASLSGQGQRASSDPGSPTGPPSVSYESLGTEVHILLQGETLTRDRVCDPTPRRTRLRSMSDVITLMTLCASLACGGIAMGLAIGTRIPGVDPFNLASFSWILAAFVMLVGKSIRVKSWCWHDFVHGRVFCQSLSELSSVTRIDAQHIFIKLFEEQSLLHLQTRGPYNAMFARKSDDGFAIDVPLALGALLNCGLVMVAVFVPGREALLMCLDLRQGTTIDVLPASYDSEEGGNQAREWIYSRDDVDTDCDGVTAKLRRWHTGRELDWDGVIGLVYIKSSEAFT